ncbi:MAG: DUF115 domain-containing protein [Treponema sp.]|nr:DUF115 domain-containing protein [Treponema sp.]
MIYSSAIQSKNGLDVPLFTNGKPMHSKYRPEEELILADGSVKEGFFLIGGIGAGYHIANLARQLDNYFIIAFEADGESLEFCKRFKTVQTLLQNPQVLLCTAADLHDTVAQRYIPALYGDFHCLFQRAWQKEKEPVCASLEGTLADTLKAVSADFSVQSHFGKIWMHNILVNLRTMTFHPVPSLEEHVLDKCAAVIAAGPSLDRSIELLKERREDFFIIATDTATGPLYRNGVEPDAIVSVDAQSVSQEHFYPIPSAEGPTGTPTVFLDLCSSPSCVRLLEGKGIRPVFFHSGHPLSRLAAEQLPLMQVETGAGTVTIAAADIARQLGFARIRLFGADFSYSRGKPYTKGTYLDGRFGSWSGRLFPAEQQFSTLMYRTALKKIGKDVYSSEVLEGYGKSLERWQEKHGYMKKRDELRSQNAEKRRGDFFPPFDFKGFMKKCLCDLGQSDDISALCSSKAFYAFIPYMAYLRQHGEEGVKAGGTLELYKAAYGFASSFASGDI